MFTIFDGRLKILFVLTLMCFSFGCDRDNKNGVVTPTIPFLVFSKIPTFTPTSTHETTPTTTPSQTPGSPQILVFYGDSSLAIGDFGDGLEHVGFSFVPTLEGRIDPTFTLLTKNFGGRTAKWAYENFQENILLEYPDLVTLWWGFDDLGGCPGIFDRESNVLIESRLNFIINEHISYMKLMIDKLLTEDVPVIIMTPVPVLLGQLPWSHLDDNYMIVWEEDRWCNFNLGLEELVIAQRNVVSEYVAKDEPVYLVDVWQIYHDNSDQEKMYMDSVHPGSVGAGLIGDDWLRVFYILSRE